MPRREVSGALMVLLAATLWGTTGTAQALGPDGITPVTVSALRMAGGGLLIVYALVRRMTVPLRSIMGWPLLIATVAMAASQPLFFSGVARTGVGVGTIVTIGSGPILASLLAWIVRGDRVGVRWVVATALSIGGAVLLVAGGEAAGVDSTGLLFALGSGVAWATYLVAAKTLFERHPAVFVSGVIFTGASLVLAPWFLTSDLTWMTTPRGLAVSLWLALIGTGLAHTLFASALARIPVASAATLSLAEPLTAAVLGVALLGEVLRWSTLVGGTLIVIGVLVITRHPVPRAQSGSA
ncbi:MAG TPA: DMT family transporter [Acidimicrobiia bacterium]|nr:DMT family transporter [Acidimicrobiia bacterium]